METSSQIFKSAIIKIKAHIICFICKNQKIQNSKHRMVLVLSQCKITSAYEEPRSSGNPEVSQTHLAISI